MSSAGLISDELGSGNPDVVAMFRSFSCRVKTPSLTRMKNGIYWFQLRDVRAVALRSACSGGLTLLPHRALPRLSSEYCVALFTAGLLPCGRKGVLWLPAVSAPT